MKLNQIGPIILLIFNLIFTVISSVYIISTNYYQLNGVEKLLVGYFIIISGIYFTGLKLLNNKNTKSKMQVGKGLYHASITMNIIAIVGYITYFLAGDIFIGYDFQLGLLITVLTPVIALVSGITTYIVSFLKSKKE
jgi:predicted DNA repair protein MutK